MKLIFAIFCITFLLLWSLANSSDVTEIRERVKRKKILDSFIISLIPPNTVKPGL
jgi:hypothetical protein